MLPSFRKRVFFQVTQVGTHNTDHSWQWCLSQTMAVLLEVIYQRCQSHPSLRWWRWCVSESFSLPLCNNGTKDFLLLQFSCTWNAESPVTPHTAT